MISIGVAQIKNTTSIIDNFLSIKSCLSLFEKSNADLVMFPECSLSGFSAKIAECTIDIISSYLDEIRDWSNRTGKAVLLPTALKEDVIYNTGFFFNQNDVKRFYKIGLTESEEKFFSIPEGYKKEIFEVKGYRFMPLICMEAQLDSDLYFSNGDVDFILWPGYWGWDESDEWKKLKQDETENLVYKNVSSWSVPLIQSNFSCNDLGDSRNSGPHGLSIVVKSNNDLVYRGPYEKQECFVVEIIDKEVKNCRALGIIE